MGSKSREVGIAHKERAEGELKELVTRLKTQGAEKGTIDRNPTVRKLRAKANDARRQLAAIDAKDALNRTLAEHKAKKLAEKAGGKKDKKHAKGKGKGGGKAKTKGAAQAPQNKKQAKPKDKKGGKDKKK